MTALRAGAILALAYALGSISWSYLLVRWIAGRDVRTVGSGNAGATNALRAGGKKAGISSLLLDIGKGAAAVALAKGAGAGTALAAGAAFAVVLGHVFPIFHGLRGGKGVATAAGAMAVLAPVALALACALFAAVVVATRTVSLGSLAAALALPLFVWLCDHLGWSALAGAWTEAAAIGLALLVVSTHRSNLRRLWAGEEHRFGRPRP